jgi:hypothetical protein
MRIKVFRMEPLRDHPIESGLKPKGPERPMLDIVFIITGIVIFGVLAGYVAALRHI